MKVIARILQDKPYGESFDELVATGQSIVHTGLYATTSDFNIGDQAMMTKIESGLPLLFWGEKIVTTEDIEAFNKQGHWFKILAPLSPNVTWEIKDGQEIEIELGYDKWEGFKLKERKDESEPVTCKVKGPCGHYH